ncbi:Acyl-CoA carboxylase epsilon subunit [Nocardioides exalbidus]|uniref:Acyl-CoA carboxylase epsilon subunit n=1 Tax=Nocardioides exalbidus TaxID=402596 RepID=A0A1H4TXT1_9ACTN|nr:acyl-CoA carboxylase subunit epsilon [Nocardioides exalbidus]SEC61275.1 Acyl-CoA carboxylase epsilon subunit [Nocardioides exalbidus]
MDTPSEQETPAPLLRVVNPDATPEEVAALVAVFSALGSADGEAPRPTRPSWNHPARGVRRTHRNGTGGWRASGLPR